MYTTIAEFLKWVDMLSIYNYVDVDRVVFQNIFYCLWKFREKELRILTKNVTKNLIRSRSGML